MINTKIKKLEVEKIIQTYLNDKDIIKLLNLENKMEENKLEELGDYFENYEKIILKILGG